MIIAIDVDGTIIDSRGILLKNAIETMKKIIKNNHQIILWTCREGKELDDFVSFLEKQKIHLFAINENPDYNSRKPLYDFLIDDRNIGTPIYFDSKGMRCVDWDRIIPILKDYGII